MIFTQSYAIIHKPKKTKTLQQFCTSLYLNGELEDGEEIYMRQPPGYETTSGIKWLHKSLYSLKQAGQRWYDTLSRTLADLGFQKIHADLGVFYTCSKETLLILAVHVDDCIITGNSPAGIKDFKKQVHECYAITDIGPIHWILGIKVTCDHYACTISLSQDSYANTILTRFNMAGANAVKCPMAPGSIFSKDQCPTDAQEIAHMHKVPYRKAIGSLMYLAVATHPDIAFAITTLSQYLNNPGVSHWEGVTRILRYVCGTTTAKLTYGIEQHNLIGYTDADRASQPHCHGISGYAFLLDGGAISWSSKKQSLVTASTTEAEYVAATHAAKEAFWLRKITAELFPSDHELITLYSDNKAAQSLAVNENYHACTKHIDIQYHFISILKMVHCPTDTMATDMLTKAVPHWKMKVHTNILGLQA